jgi:hypothetical protein
MFDVDRINLTAAFTSPLMKDATASYWPILPGMLLIVPLWMLRRRPDLLLWVVWIGGTLGFITLLDLIRGTSHLRFLRYVWLATPAILMIGMLLLKGMPVWLRHAVPAAIVLLGLQFRGMAYISEEPDWRNLGRWIDDNSKHDEPLIFASGLQPEWYSQIFYLGVAHYSHSFPRGIVKLTGDASPSLMRQIPGSTAWVISGPLKTNPPRVMADDIAALLPGATIIDQQVFPNLAICTHVQLNRPSPATR